MQTLSLDQASKDIIELIVVGVVDYHSLGDAGDDKSDDSDDDAISDHDDIGGGRLPEAQRNNANGNFNNDPPQGDVYN